MGRKKKSAVHRLLDAKRNFRSDGYKCPICKKEFDDLSCTHAYDDVDNHYDALIFKARTRASKMSRCGFRVNDVVIVRQLPPHSEDLYPFKEGDHLLFLGEVTNLPDQCIVVDQRGRTFWGHYIEHFRKPTPDEVQ